MAHEDGCVAPRSRCGRPTTSGLTPDTLCLLLLLFGRFEARVLGVVHGRASTCCVLWWLPHSRPMILSQVLLEWNGQHSSTVGIGVRHDPTTSWHFLFFFLVLFASAANLLGLEMGNKKSKSPRIQMGICGRQDAEKTV